MPDITFTVDEELARWFVDNHEVTVASRNHPLSPVQCRNRRAVARSDAA